MEKIKMNFAHKFFRILKWAFLIILVLYLILVIVRVFHFYDVEKTDKQVQIIYATKITVDDVIGKNLPPDPGEDANKTIIGIDANQNGIRDDVELAIFKEYPDSVKTRAALLQYALAQQMQVVQPFVNKVIATEVIRMQSRADSCLSDTLVPRKSPEDFREYSDLEKIHVYLEFVEDRQLNTDERIKSRSAFFDQVGSHSQIRSESCDVDYSKIDN